MTFKSDFICYPSSEGTGSADFFPPDPPLVDVDSSAAFDEEVDDDKEVGELELELSLKNLDDFYATFHDDDTPVAPNSSAATCSTDSSYQQSSHYPCDPTQPDYSIPSGIESRGSVNDELHSTHASIYSAVYSNAPPSIPPHNPAKVISDYGTLDIDPNFIANDIAVQQSAASVVSPPALPPDRVIADPDVQMAPEPDKPFKCSCECQSPLGL